MNVLDEYALMGITDLLESADTCHLWMCGSRRLNHKLRASVRTFSIVSSTAFDMKWPGILAYFSQLHTFRIVSKELTSKSTVANVDFTTLPASLKKIEVAFDRADRQLYGTFVTSRDRFPNLHTVIIGKTNNVKGKPIRGAILTTLPKSVTRFVAKRDHSDIKDAVFHAPMADIPPNLTIIEAHNVYLPALEDASHIEHAHLFANLTSLAIAMDSGDWMAILPTKTLLSLEMRVMYDAHLHLIPPRLEKLTVWSMEEQASFARALPHILRTLWCTHFPQFDEHVLRLLPRGITRIDSCLAEILTAEMAAALPPALTRVKCQVLPSVLPHLPAGITKMSIMNVGGIGDIDIRHPIPPACTHLTMFTLSEASAKMLPPTLTELTLDLIADIPVCVPLLPQTLQVLSVRNMYPAKHLSLLPRGLRALHSNVYDIDKSLLDDGRSLSYALPRALEFLPIGPVDTVSPEWYAGMPSTLVNFTMAVDNFGIDDATTMSRLFPRLGNLYINVNKNFDYCALAHLPPSIHTLAVGSLASGPVQKLSYDEVCDTLAALPRRLRTCNIPPVWPFVKDMREYLPKTLTVFRVAGKKVPWFTPLPSQPRNIYQVPGTSLSW